MLSSKALVREAIACNSCSSLAMFDGLACLDTLAVADVGVPHQLINAGSRGLGGQLLVKCRELRVDPLKSPVHRGVVSVGGLGSQPPLNQGKGSPEVGEP